MTPTKTAAESGQPLTLLYPLRLLASFAVVWHHMRNEMFLGLGVGLPLFLVLMFGLAASSTRREPLWRFVRRRTSFLLIPWVRWSVVYVVALGLADLLRGVPIGARLGWNMLLYGGHLSLWFLPFAAFAIIAVKFLQGAVRTRPARHLMVPMALLGLGAIWAAAQFNARISPMTPLESWVRMLPAIPFGLALGQSRRIEDARTRRLHLLAVAVIAALGVLMSLPEGAHADLALRFAATMPLACAGFAFSPPVPRVLRYLAAFNFGVYLIHPLIGKIMVQLWDTHAWPATLHTLAAWSTAAAVLLLLRRLRPNWQECRQVI